MMLMMLLLATLQPVECFSVTFVARRGKGGLKQNLEDKPSKSNNPASSVRSLNQGKGQEITGVTLPAPGNMKGWEFGEGFRMVCANVDEKLYALEGQCPRCVRAKVENTVLLLLPFFPNVSCW